MLRFVKNSNEPMQANMKIHQNIYIYASKFLNTVTLK